MIDIEHVKKVRNVILSDMATVPPQTLEELYITCLGAFGEARTPEDRSRYALMALGIATAILHNSETKTK